MSIKALFALFVLLQAADVWSTVRLLRRGGRELNPVMYELMSYMSAGAALILVKIMTIGAFILLGLLFNGSIWLLVGLNLVYIGVLLFNLRQLRVI